MRHTETANPLIERLFLRGRPKRARRNGALKPAGIVTQKKEGYSIETQVLAIKKNLEDQYVPIAESLPREIPRIKRNMVRNGEIHISYLICTMGQPKLPMYTYA
jgi:hypothetical protein